MEKKVKGKIYQEPSPRALKALALYRENGFNKQKALLDAGYSAVTAKTPSKFFKSYAIQQIVKDTCGVRPEHIIQRLKKFAYTRKIVHADFPLHIDEVAENEKDTATKMTDDDIRDYVQNAGGVVWRIVHDKAKRRAFYYVDNVSTNLEAIEKLINIIGMYAPKQTETKTDVNLNFSLSRLRERVEMKGIDIIRDVTPQDE